MAITSGRRQNGSGWQRHFGQELGPFEINWGHASSPTLFGDTLILLCDHEPASYLLAVDTRTGRDRWKADRGRGRQSYTTPFVVAASTGPELIVNSSERVDAYDPRTGTPLWHVGGTNQFPIPSPAYHDGVLYLSRGYRSGPYMAVRPGGKGDVTETHKVWESGRTENRLGSPVIKDGYVFLPTMPGMAECIELKTGKKVWDERIRGRGAKNDTWSSMVLAGDRIYVVNQSANTIVLKASPKFEVLAVNSVGNEMCNASVAVSNGDIFIRTHEHLWCVSGTTRTAKN